MKSIDIKRFLDDEGRIVSMPSKHAPRLEVLKYLVTKFETGRFYKEREINAILEEWHTFRDFFLLRRELVDAHLLSRTRDGAQYWKEETTSPQENEQN